MDNVIFCNQSYMTGYRVFQGENSKSYAVVYNNSNTKTARTPYLQFVELDELQSIFGDDISTNEGSYPMAPKSATKVLGMQEIPALSVRRKDRTKTTIHFVYGVGDDEASCRQALAQSLTRMIDQATDFAWTKEAQSFFKAHGLCCMQSREQVMSSLRTDAGLVDPE